VRFVPFSILPSIEVFPIDPVDHLHVRTGVYSFYRQIVNLLHRVVVTTNISQVFLPCNAKETTLTFMQGKASTISRHAVPGQKAGLIAARRTGLIRGSYAFRPIDIANFVLIMPLTLRVKVKD